MSRNRGVVVAGWTGSANLGDELVHAGVRRLLARAGVDGSEITAITVDPQATQARFGGHAVGAVDGLAHIARARLLVWGGGGIVQDETSALNLPYHLARPAVAAITGTPFVGVGLGVGPLRGATAPRQVRLLRRAEALTVRDDDSSALLRRCGVDDVTVASDAAFALDRRDVAVDDVIVAALRPWGGRVDGWQRLVPAGRRASRRTGADADAAVTRQAQALDTIARRTGLTVRLVAFDGDKDVAHARAVASHMQEPATIHTPSVEDIVDVVAAGRLVVAMRYHGVVSATLAGRPVLAMSYSPKVASLATSLGPGAITLPWDAEAVPVASAAVSLLEDEHRTARAVRDARSTLQAATAAHVTCIQEGLVAAG